MKAQFLKFGVLALAVVACDAMAASTTAQLSVSATVNAACRFNSVGPTTLAFGAAIPATQATDVVVTTASIPYRCSTGTTASVAVTASTNGTVAQPKMSDGATHTLNYSVVLNNAAGTGTGLGAGNDINMTVTGTLLASDIQAAYVGATSTAYTDTLTMTISP